MNSKELLEEMRKSIGQAFSEQFKEELIKGLVQDAVQEVLADKDLTFKKTEELLYDYPDLLYSWEARVDIYGKNDNTAVSLKKSITFIEECLESISNDPYFEIIDMIYFQKKSANTVCAYYNATPKTISTQRKRLVKLMRAKLFSIEYLKELMFN